MSTEQKKPQTLDTEDIKKPEILEAKDEKKTPDYNPFKEFQANPTLDTINNIRKKADDEKNVLAINFMFIVSRDGINVNEKELLKADGKAAGEYAQKGAQAGSALCQIELAKALINEVKDKDDKKKIESIDKLLVAAKANGAKIASFYQGLKLSKLGEFEDAEKFYEEAIKDGILEASYALAEIKLSRARRNLSALRNEVDAGLNLMRSYFAGSQKAISGKR